MRFLLAFFLLAFAAFASAAPMAKRSNLNIQIAGLNVSVWQPTATVVGPAPLVIFSHGFHGNGTQSTFLMEALARDGYMVVAPNHRDASWRSGLRPQVPFGDVRKWDDQTFQDRAQDINKLVAALHQDEAWNGKIDWSRVALAGHSLGGYTSLGLAGAWPTWTLKDARIKAVLALSPYCQPFNDHGHLESLGVPVMYQGGTRDRGITPFLKRKGGAFAKTRGPAYLVEFQEAGHFAWTDLNREFHQDIIYYSLAFLDKYLKGVEEPLKQLPSVSLLQVKP